MLSEQLHIFTQLLRKEKWSEAEAVARNVSSLDQLESKLKYKEFILLVRIYFTSSYTPKDEQTLKLRTRCNLMKFSDWRKSAWQKAIFRKD